MTGSREEHQTKIKNQLHIKPLPEVMFPPYIYSTGSLRTSIIHLRQVDATSKNATIAKKNRNSTWEVILFQNHLRHRKKLSD